MFNIFLNSKNIITNLIENIYDKSFFEYLYNKYDTIKAKIVSFLYKSEKKLFIIIYIMNKIIKNILISSFLFVIIDYIYLSFIKNQFGKMIFNIQNNPMIIKYMGAIICYILLVICFNYFILYKNSTLKEAFLLGFIIYGVFDSTNYAILTNWNYKLSIIDSIWGGILFTIITFIMKLKYK